MRYAVMSGWFEASYSSSSPWLTFEWIFSISVVHTYADIYGRYILKSQESENLLDNRYIGAGWVVVVSRFLIGRLLG